MASEIQIYNRALQKLGAKAITSPTENSPNARACNRAYADLRDLELRSHPWNFALKRVSVAADASGPAFGPNNQFTLPSDFLRLHPDHDYKAETDWQIEGQKLLTDDEAPLYLRYVRRVEDPNVMDPIFREALATRIAFELCEKITQSNTKKDRLRIDHRDLIMKARQVNAIEKTATEPREDTWITVRRPSA